MSDKKNPTGMPPNKAVKWPTPEERQAACKSFCEHIEKGYSMKSWPDADKETVMRYVKDFPKDFDPEAIGMSKRKCLLFWEKMGIAGTSGKLKGFNARSWEVTMNNRAGWTTNVDLTSNGEKIQGATLAESAALYAKMCKGDDDE